MVRWDVRFDLRLDTFSGELNGLAADIASAAETVRSVPLPPAAVARIERRSAARSAAGAIAIEGELIDQSAAEGLLAGQGAAPVTKAETDVVGAHRMLARARSAPANEVTEQLISTLHRAATEGGRHGNGMPGVYRALPVTIGEYTPPGTNEQVRKLMAELTRWINSGDRRNWAAPVRAAVVHFYIVSIAPFGDANAVSACGVETALLADQGLTPRGLAGTAAFYGHARDAYIHMLDSVRFHSNGNLTDWVLFSMDGLLEELLSLKETTLAEASRMAFDAHTRERIYGAAGPRRSDVADRLARLAAALPADGVLARSAQLSLTSRMPEYRRLNDRTLRRDIERLLALGVATSEEGRILPNLRAVA